MNGLSIESLKHIISKLMENAVEASSEWKKNKNDSFADARSEAYYEVLDIIQSELEIEGIDLSEVGLDINLLEKLM